MLCFSSVCIFKFQFIRVVWVHKTKQKKTVRVSFVKRIKAPEKNPNDMYAELKSIEINHDECYESKNERNDWFKKTVNVYVFCYVFSKFNYSNWKHLRKRIENKEKPTQDLQAEGKQIENTSKSDSDGMTSKLASLLCTRCTNTVIVQMRLYCWYRFGRTAKLSSKCIFFIPRQFTPLYEKYSQRYSHR